MLNKKTFAILAVALSASIVGYATPDAMRGASATQLNNQLASSLCLTRDANANLISFHVNGISPQDAETLLKRNPTPLSTEFTIISGANTDGSQWIYMLPTNIATPQVVETISKELISAGAINVEITKQATGKS